VAQCLTSSELAGGSAGTVEINIQSGVGDVVEAKGIILYRNDGLMYTLKI